jgi:hypothetical protein
MGVKDKKLNKNKESNDKGTKTFSLDEADFNYLKAMGLIRNNTYAQMQQLITAFLSYLAGAKWGYNPKDLLKYEFDEEINEVKVTKIEEDNPSPQ